MVSSISWAATPTQILSQNDLVLPLKTSNFKQKPTFLQRMALKFILKKASKQTQKVKGKDKEKPEPYSLAAFILGIVGLLTLVTGIGFILGILAIIFGAIGIRRINTSEYKKYKSLWLAKTGLTLGIIAVVLFAVIVAFILTFLRIQD